MDRITMLLGLSFLVSTYICWLGYVLHSRRTVDASWALGISLFLELIAFVVKMVIPTDFPFLFLMIPMQISILVPVLLYAPSKVAKSLNQPGIKIWLTFILFCVVSVLWSADQAYGLSKWQILLLRGFLPGCFALVTFSAFGKMSWKPVLILGSLYAVLTLLLGQDSPEFPGRVALNGANPIWASRLLLLVLSIAIWNNKWSWKARLSVATLSFVAAMATQSRGPFVSFLLTSLFFFIIAAISSRLSKNQKSWRVICASATIIICSLIFVSSMQYDTAEFANFSDLGRLQTLLNFNELQTDDNLQGRLFLQKQALASFLENPLFGIGIGGFSHFGENYPHNLVVEILCELGFVGFALWLATIWIGFRSASGNRLLQVLMLQSLLYALSSGDLGFNYELVMMSIIALMKQPIIQEKDINVESSMQSNWRLVA